MITSANKRLYDFFLNELNQNTQNVEFSGNFMFKFWQQGANVNEFEILYKNSENPDDINFLTKEVVPVVDVQQIEIPYVHRNERSEFEKEFYVAIRIEYDVNEFNQRIIEFDEDNAKYQALLEQLDDMRNNLVYNDGDFKYALKIKQPQKVNVFKYNGDYYQILAVNMNLSSVKFGNFGSEMSIYLGLTQSETTNDDFILDIVEANFITVKSTKVNPVLGSNTYEEETRVRSRNWQVQCTVNYRGNTVDNRLWDEVHARSNMKQEYELRIKQGSLDYTERVYITNLNTIIINNSVEQITFTAERV